MNKTSDIFKALGDPNRLKLMMALMREPELCACQLTELLHVSGATASKHMSQLVQAGLVQSRKEGRWVYYQLKKGPPPNLQIFNLLNLLLKSELENPNLTQKLQSITSINPQALCKIQRDRNCC